MNDFKLVIDCFFDVWTRFFNVILGNWFMSFCFLILVFSLLINLFLMIKGTK